MLPSEMYFGKFEAVFLFYDAMPTGVTVSETGRIFICFPKWGDDVKFTVAEIVRGTLQPYPSLDANVVSPSNITTSFISVQSVVADGQGTLWVLDTGAPNFSEPIKGGAKLVAVDLNTNTIRSRKIVPNGIMETIAHDPRILWPDTFSIGPDQYLYFIVNQLHRQSRFHYGNDLWQKPYSLLRMKIDEPPAPTY